MQAESIIVVAMPFDRRVDVGTDGGGGGRSPPPDTGSGIVEELIPRIIDATIPPWNPIFSSINLTDRSEEIPPCPVKIPSSLFSARVIL